MIFLVTIGESHVGRLFVVGGNRIYSIEYILGYFKI